MSERLSKTCIGENKNQAANVMVKINHELRITLNQRSPSYPYIVRSQSVLRLLNYSNQPNLILLKASPFRRTSRRRKGSKIFLSANLPAKGTLMRLLGWPRGVSDGFRPWPFGELS